MSKKNRTVIEEVFAQDVRTDGFMVLKFGKTDLPVGLRLGTMPREYIREASGEIAQDAKGLFVQFQSLPGAVSFTDTGKYVFRDDEIDGYVFEAVKDTD